MNIYFCIVYLFPPQSGYLDYGEFRRVLANLNIAMIDADFDELMRESIDPNGDGRVTCVPGRVRCRFVCSPNPASRSDAVCNADLADTDGENSKLRCVSVCLRL